MSVCVCVCVCVCVNYIYIALPLFFQQMIFHLLIIDNENIKTSLSYIARQN